MILVLYIIAGPLFLLSIAGYIYVQLRLKPREDSELDDYHWEFEDQHPVYARYLKWSRISLAAAVISALLLFLAMVL
jgi:hypothetical protein